MAKKSTYASKTFLILLLLVATHFSTATRVSAQVGELVSKYDVNRDGTAGTVLRSKCEGFWQMTVSTGLQTDEGRYWVMWRSLDLEQFIEPGRGYHSSYDAGPSCEKVDRGVRFLEGETIKLDEGHAPAYREGIVLARIFGTILERLGLEIFKAVFQRSGSIEEVVLSSTLTLDGISYEATSSFRSPVSFMATSIKHPNFPTGWAGKINPGEKIRFGFSFSRELMFENTLLVAGKLIVNIEGLNHTMPIVTHGFFGITLPPKVSMPTITEVSPRKILVTEPIVVIHGTQFIEGAHIYLISPKFPDRELRLKIVSFSSNRIVAMVPNAEALPEGPVILTVANPDRGVAFAFGIELTRPVGRLDIERYVAVVAVVAIVILVYVILKRVLKRRA